MRSVAVPRWVRQKFPLKCFPQTWKFHRHSLCNGYILILYIESIFIITNEWKVSIRRPQKHLVQNKEESMRSLWPSTAQVTQYLPGGQHGGDGPGHSSVPEEEHSPVRNTSFVSWSWDPPHPQDRVPSPRYVQWTWVLTHGHRGRRPGPRHPTSHHLLPWQVGPSLLQPDLLSISQALPDSQPLQLGTMAGIGNTAKLVPFELCTINTFPIKTSNILFTQKLNRETVRIVIKLHPFSGQGDTSFYSIITFITWKLLSEN